MNSKDLVLREEVYAVVGCALEVLKILGHGLSEKPYENALVVELRLRNVIVQQQEHFPVVYKGVEVGEYVPDLITHERLIVDAKVIDRITNHERGQMLNYLRVSRHRVGLLINFKHGRLEWERLILSDLDRPAASPTPTQSSEP